MQTQEGFLLVIRDETPTKEVHVFSKEWALQGEGYNPQYFDKGRCRPASLPVAMACASQPCLRQHSFHCHTVSVLNQSVEGVAGRGLTVLRLKFSMVYAAAGAFLQQCAQICHNGWEAQKGHEALFKLQHHLWCRVGS